MLCVEVDGVGNTFEAVCIKFLIMNGCTCVDVSGVKRDNEKESRVVLHGRTSACWRGLWCWLHFLCIHTLYCY